MVFDIPLFIEEGLILAKNDSLCQLILYRTDFLGHGITVICEPGRINDGTGETGAAGAELKVERATET
jgi:hypothetical protein